MKKILLLSLIATLISSVSFAKIFRIGYTGPTIPGTDFSELQLAHDAASTGDTLLFFPGSFYCRATKRLVYIGYGYYLEGIGSNPNLQLLTGTCYVQVYLDATASGSIYEGIENVDVRSYYEENVNDVIVRRCKGVVGLNNTTGTTCNNWQISQCAGLNLQPSWNGGKATNFRVDNCTIASLYNLSDAGSTGQFNNCNFIILAQLDLKSNAINFQNCIFYGTNISEFSNSVFQNNIFGQSNPGLTGSNNQYSISFGIGDVNSIFIGYPSEVTGQSSDNKFKLKAGSPAIGAGIGGVDLGIYGGANPYRLSGIPAIPAFYKLTAPTPNATTNPYTITFSVRSNN